MYTGLEVRKVARPFPPHLTLPRHTLPRHVRVWGFCRLWAARTDFGFHVSIGSGHFLSWLPQLVRAATQSFLGFHRSVARRSRFITRLFPFSFFYESKSRDALSLKVWHAFNLAQ